MQIHIDTKGYKIHTFVNITVSVYLSLHDLELGSVGQISRIVSLCFQRNFKLLVMLSLLQTGVVSLSNFRVSFSMLSSAFSQFERVIFKPVC